MTRIPTPEKKDIASVCVWERENIRLICKESRSTFRSQSCTPRGLHWHWSGSSPSRQKTPQHAQPCSRWSWEIASSSMVITGAKTQVRQYRMLQDLSAMCPSPRLRLHGKIWDQTRPKAANFKIVFSRFEVPFSSLFWLVRWVLSIQCPAWKLVP